MAKQLNRDSERGSGLPGYSTFPSEPVTFVDDAGCIMRWTGKELQTIDYGCHYVPATHYNTAMDSLRGYTIVSDGLEGLHVYRIGFDGREERLS